MKNSVFPLRIIMVLSMVVMIALLCVPSVICAQSPGEGKEVPISHPDTLGISSKDTIDLDDDTLALDSVASVPLDVVDNGGFYKSFKGKFIEGNAGFMSLVALALIIGLAFCIERIIYLSMSEIDAKKFMRDIEKRIKSKDKESAMALCEKTRGPVALICGRGLQHSDESLEVIERTISSYGSVQAANLERGCSWITLFIAMAPSLGFLGTVIGMVMSFDQIQMAGDINPTIVASGMKVALITTIFGIIVALVLQLFYNYILSKIEHITAQMEESAITFLDIMAAMKMDEEGVNGNTSA